MMESSRHSNSSSFKYPAEFGYILIETTGVSLTICTTIIILLIKNRYGRNFFTWPIVERFTMYSVSTDALFYIAQSLNIVNMEFGKYDGKRGDFLCSFLGIFILEFGGCQLELGIILAVYVFVLVTHNRHMSLGKYDYALLVTTFGIPLVSLIVAESFNQIQPNVLQ